MKQKKEKLAAQLSCQLAACRCKWCQLRPEMNCKSKLEKRSEPGSLYGAEALIYDFYFSA